MGGVFQINLFRQKKTDNKSLVIRHDGDQTLFGWRRRFECGGPRRYGCSKGPAHLLCHSFSEGMGIGVSDGAVRALQPMFAQTLQDWFPNAHWRETFQELITFVDIAGAQIGGWC